MQERIIQNFDQNPKMCEMLQISEQTNRNVLRDMVSISIFLEEGVLQVNDRSFKCEIFKQSILNEIHLDLKNQYMRKGMLTMFGIS